MEAISGGLDLARWQFGITTVYHFILVPLTIGMSLLVAIMQTMWHKTGKEYWLKATRFFGKLFLINFALGVATGIVQEFQFGMNWSEYSRFVGDIFGAPLAFEALLSFFIESTFLGLWIFGWGKLSKKAHLAMIWMVAIGVNTSMLWIIGANSWMQTPVGAVFDPASGRAQMEGAMSFFEVIGNPTMWLAVFHTVTSSWMVAATLIAGIGVWWMVRANNAGGAGEVEAREIWRPIARFGMWVLVVAGVLTVVSGHLQGQHITYAQPAKMAAAEAICEGESGDFSLMAFGDCSQGNESMTHIIQIPGALGFVARNNFSATIPGVAVTDQQMAEHFASIQAKDPAIPAFEADTYAPPIMITFWSFRLMMALGGFSALLALWGLYATRSGKVSSSKALAKFALLSLPMPFLAASFGWIFTEIGRQPFIVYPNLKDGLSVQQQAVYMLTENGVSAAVPAWQVGVTMIVFTLLYLGLGVVWFLLMKRYTQEGINTPVADDGPANDSQELSFAY
ncbi:MAG: cytochrome ubiquinol oxidase subunit I [Actinomycetaceae bacterium]|nr:cytochrome ubiquinol oxidase subunit I [Actinomycetaceae bacterium]